jgi:flagellar hook-associated protein 3 FlgL
MSLQNSMRLTVARAQNELLKLQEETVTGRYADVGAVLGAKTARTLNLHRDVQRLDALKSTNSITTSRLSASQSALGLMSETANKAMEQLIIFKDNSSGNMFQTAKDAMSSLMSTFTTAANTSFGGEYVFAGINTDVSPLNDYLAPGSAAKASFDTAFDTFMATNGFVTAGVNDPSLITPAAMETFLADLETSFMGADWATDWSNASDQNMMSRISTTETVQSSTNTNSDGMRQFALGMVIGYELLQLNLSAETREATFNAASGHVALAISGIDAERSKLGISEARIKQANTSITAQLTILTTSIKDMESVDTYEAATRVTTLESQLSLAYTLTSRIQNLSLLNYL